MRNIYFILILFFAIPLVGQESTFKEPEGLDSIYRLDLLSAIQNRNIDPYYKNIIEEGRFIANPSEYKMMALTDSLLFNCDPGQSIFYFISFTKSMNGSDGFYSEAVSMGAFRFVTTQTSKFLSYFDVGVQLGEKDLNNWARFIFGEIQIVSEKKELKAIDELEVLLKENAKGMKNEYLEIIDKLIKKIRIEVEKGGFKR